MSKLFISCLSFLCLGAQAVEFYPDGGGQTPRAYEVKKGDTLGGYPLYHDGGGWRFYNYIKNTSTGGSGRQISTPVLLMAKYHITGAIEFTQTTVVTVEQDTSGGWMGEPCNVGNNAVEIARVNVVRGRLDRCAHISLTQKSIGGVMKSVVRGFAIETNASGRYYSVDLWYLPETAGKTNGHYQNDPNFKVKAQSWVVGMQQAVVRAASYDKPANAFDGADSFISLVTGRATTVSSPTISAPQEGALENRLKALKNLFDKGLISQSEYDVLRKKALDEAGLK